MLYRHLLLLPLKNLLQVRHLLTITAAPQAEGRNLLEEEEEEEEEQSHRVSVRREKSPSGLRRTRV